MVKRVSMQAVALWFAASADASAAQPPSSAISPTRHDFIEAALNHPERPAADRERDAGSKPADVLHFLGIAPGMQVLDLNAGGGYYTELLSRAVGPHGKVIAHNNPGAKELLSPETFEQRYGGQRLPNVVQVFARHNDLELVTSSLDGVLMSLVYHDLYWRDPEVDWGPIDQHALLTALYRMLKPGGFIGVIDHYAAAGIDPWVSAKAMHRIDPAVVRRDFQAAGFALEAESSALRNAGDDYSLGVFDAAVHGKTDRFVMRFRRP